MLIIVSPSIHHINLLFSSKRYILRFILETVDELEAVRALHSMHLLAVAYLEVWGFVLPTVVAFILDLASELILLPTEILLILHHVIVYHVIVLLLLRLVLIEVALMSLKLLRLVPLRKRTFSLLTISRI
jgi:hypothetical protein